MEEEARLHTIAQERERILEEYKRRARRFPRDYYSVLKVANLFGIQSRNRSLVELLESSGLQFSADQQILEVGCGDRGWIPFLAQIGIIASDLVGVDLMQDRLRTAKSIAPGVGLIAGDAAQLPHRTGSFDVVLQSLVFTSILDEEMRRALAEEMMRVLRPNGFIVWYDFVYDNPWNPHVRGISKSAVSKYFAGSTIYLKKTTMAPPLARRIVPVSWVLAEFIQALSVFNTHILCLVIPRA